MLRTFFSPSFLLPLVAHCNTDYTLTHVWADVIRFLLLT